MSYKQSVISELNDLCRGMPSAILFEREAWRMGTWGRSKIYLEWTTGEPIGWNELEEGVEYYVAQKGEELRVFIVGDKSYTALYPAPREDRLEECADYILDACNVSDDDWD